MTEALLVPVTMSVPSLAVSRGLAFPTSQLPAEVSTAHIGLNSPVIMTMFSTNTVIPRGPISEA